MPPPSSSSLFTGLKVVQTERDMWFRRRNHPTLYKCQVWPILFSMNHVEI